MAESLPGLGAGRLIARASLGGGLVLHELEVAAERAATYATPGQYVSLALAHQETYFALAGEPGSATWEVLVRAGGDVADELLRVPLGATVAVSTALGEGFPMGAAHGRRLFVLATGSGFSAVRAVLRARVRGGVAASTELLLGVRARADVPLAAELAQLRRDGLAVTVCCSKERVDDEGCASGHVQDVLMRRARAEASLLAGAILFAAGTTAMVDQLRALARELHVSEADVRTNY